MFVVPAASADTTPPSTVATFSSPDAHVTSASAGTVVAVNVSVLPAMIDVVSLLRVTLGSGVTLFF